MSILQDLYPSGPDAMYCAIVKIKLFISESCPILVLTTILSNTKNDPTNYQGPTTSRENAIRKYQNFPHTFLKNFV